MAKKNAERRAIAEKMLQEQKRAERRRSTLILGGCLVLVVGLLAAALIPYVKDQREKSKLEGTAVSKLGVSAAAAKCGDIIEQSASGSGQHEVAPTKISYPDAPPAFGKHWGNFLQGSELRNFYTSGDRPEVERLVHSLEHGYSLLWYDATIAEDKKQVDLLKTIADKYEGEKVIITPWTAADGGEFPDGKHLALTHWYADPKNPGDDKSQKGIWKYCDGTSGKVIADFVKDYPDNAAPEPGAI